MISPPLGRLGKDLAVAGNASGHVLLVGSSQMLISRPGVR